jgi:Rod binding domain-containing protein
MSVYNDMIDQQLNQSLESAGGLGLAGSIYAGMLQNAGLSTSGTSGSSK